MVFDKKEYQFSFAGYLLDYLLALYLSYSPATTIIGFCHGGVATIGARSQGIFLSRHMDSGLDYGLIVNSVYIFREKNFL